MRAGRGFLGTLGRGHLSHMKYIYIYTSSRMGISWHFMAFLASSFGGRERGFLGHKVRERQALLSLSLFENVRGRAWETSCPSGVPEAGEL